MVFGGEGGKQRARHSLVLPQNAVLQVVQTEIEAADVVEKGLIRLIEQAAPELAEIRLAKLELRVLLDFLQKVVEVHALINVEEKAGPLSWVERHDIHFLELANLVFVGFELR